MSILDMFAGKQKSGPQPDEMTGDDGAFDYEAAPYPQTDEEEESVYHEYSKATLQRRVTAMAGERAVWKQNLLFLEGHQWWAYNNGKYLFPEGPKWKKYPVRNLLQPYLRLLMAKLTKNRPATQCMPATTDTKDIEAAKLGDKILEAKWRELDQAAKLREAIAWTGTCGNAWLMPYWREDTGVMKPLMTMVPVPDEQGQVTLAPAPADEQGNPILDESGQPDPEAEPSYYEEGDVALRVFGPHQVYPDTTAVSEDEIVSVLIVDVMDPRHVLRMWPQMRGKKLDTGTVGDYDEIGNVTSYLESSRGANRNLLSGVGGGSRDEESRVEVIHFFEKPSKNWPHGRAWVTTSGHVLEPPGPLPDQLWPVVHLMKDIDIPGQMLGKANMSNAIGIQRDYNRSTQLIDQHHELFMRGKWVVPRGSGIRRGSITEQPGEVIQYAGMTPPQMVDVKPLPHKVYEERSHIIQMAEYILGVHKASMGTADPGVTAGRALLALQEADDSDLAPMSERIESVVARLSWAFLRLIQANYDDERTIRYVGKNRIYQAASFKGADLSGVADVKPIVGSSLPWTKMAKQNFVLDLIQRIPQLFMDPETGMLDADRMRESLEVGGSEAVDRGSDADYAEVQREHMKLKQWDGTTPLPFAPMAWQNHMIHVKQHGRLMKDSEFEDMEPHQQQALMQHYLAHLTTIQMMFSGGAQDSESSAGSGPAAQTMPIIPGQPGMPPDQGAALHVSETSQQPSVTGTG